MSSITLSQVVVTVEYGNSALPTTVPEHEVPILKALHGSEAVKVVGKSDDDIELPASAEAELARLARKYDRIGNNSNPVPTVFPMPSLMEKFGFKTDVAADGPAPQASARRHNKKDDAAPQASDSKKKG